MLTKKHKHFLRTLAGRQKPQIIIGKNGLSAALFAELEAALAHHELLKIKLPAADKNQKREWTNAILKTAGADFVHAIGNILVIYRADENAAKIIFPNNENCD